MRRCVFAVVCLAVTLLALGSHDACAADATTEFRGRIVDADSGQLLPARIYIRSDKGDWYFPKSVSPDGSAVEYRKERPSGSTEMHTTLSAHPFSVKLPPGRYDVTVERGKEYLTFEKSVDVGDKPLELTIPLKRWINLAERGWFSGDTHTHRAIDELPNIILAEDLNVALPLSYWVTKSDTAPTQGNRSTGEELKSDSISVDESQDRKSVV